MTTNTNAALIAAAQAVVDRWDTPAWKDVEHTAVFINRLRAALSTAAAQPPAGFVLAPCEATEEMKTAAVKYANGTAVYKNVAVEALRIEEGIYGEVYGAMLAAAPKAEPAPVMGNPISAPSGEYPALPEPDGMLEFGCPAFGAEKMHAYYDLGRDKAKAWMRLADQRAIEVAELKIELGRLRALAASPTAQAAPAAVAVPAGIYVASRASLPERPARWRALRTAGWPIVSTWIDEAGPGETDDVGELWVRIAREVASAQGVVLHVEPDDFPLKGALIEVGMALSLGKRVGVYAPGVALEGRSMRPLGSWAAHPLVRITPTLQGARDWIEAAPQLPAEAQEPVKRVYLVATGEEHEGEATYTRYDDAPPPLCDAECLFSHPAPQQAVPTSEQAGAPVAHRMLRKNGFGKWVHDANYWADGPAPAELVRDCAKYPGLYRIECAYASPASGGAAPVAEGDAEDAARYRWLRDTGCGEFKPFTHSWMKTAQECDAAIDAARAQAKEGGV
jgi:hypothetical protein